MILWCVESLCLVKTLMGVMNSIPRNNRTTDINHYLKCIIEQIKIICKSALDLHDQWGVFDFDWRIDRRNRLLFPISNYMVRVIL